MLSQSPSAIKMRRFRANHPRTAPSKPSGRRPNLDKHRALIAAVERPGDGRWTDRSVLAARLGYASPDSLMKSYRLALAALAPVSPTSTPPAPQPKD